ncbi:unnamed protein product [Rangifer tarandus platyrhynchus]|uniref:Uncharacterized protein n=2 Tax=Rangifer tarandus platyrhynchus TaxID=3082113 RepID=A0ABN8YYL8_RANTA|nr:unnamed protein product [Rangifer tarandus platyrhynchus]CAI9693646.1 unnamed protein product [Rangifer tarandus platyrhynchus]
MVSAACAPTPPRSQRQSQWGMEPSGQCSPVVPRGVRSAVGWGIWGGREVQALVPPLSLAWSPLSQAARAPWVSQRAQVRVAGMPQPELRCCRGSPISGLRSLHGPRTARGPESPPAVDPEVFNPVWAPLHPLVQCPVRRRRSGAQNLEQHSQAFAESMSEQGASGEGAASSEEGAWGGAPVAGSTSPRAGPRAEREAGGCGTGGAARGPG